jgi:hypothetical protein
LPFDLIIRRADNEQQEREQQQEQQEQQLLDDDDDEQVKVDERNDIGLLGWPTLMRANGFLLLLLFAWLLNAVFAEAWFEWLEGDSTLLAVYHSLSLLSLCFAC